MKTHYYPLRLMQSMDEVERAPCGTWAGEFAQFSDDWDGVDCKRCIRRKPYIMGRRKAYTVTDGDEGHAVIVYATSSIAARRVGAEYLGTDFESIASCRRSPWADEYESVGGPTPDIRIEHGWWLECWHCGQRTDEDTDGGPIVRGEAVFCSQECCARHDREKHLRIEAVNDFVIYVETMLPGCRVDSIHIYDYRLAVGDPSRTSAEIYLPNGQGPITVPLGSGRATASQDLHEPFKQYLASAWPA